MNKKEITKQLLKEKAYSSLLQYKGRKVFASITSVARSGMSRWLKFYILDTDKKTEITKYIANFLDYRHEWEKGLQVGGCGVDMIFSVLSNLNYEMAEMTTGKTTRELLETKECGERIYDNYFFDADRYGDI